MNNKPDFIVDSSGKVRDVRRMQNIPASGNPAQQENRSDHAPDAKAPQKINVHNRKTDHTPYLVLIPIGLVFILVVAFAWYLNSSTKNTISESYLRIWNQGTDYYVKGDYQMALINFNLVIQSYPEFGDAYNSRGLVYLDESKYDQALSDFNRTIELMPDSAMGYSNRAITYYSMGEFDEAIQDLEKAIQLDIDFAKAYYNRGLVYLSLNRYESAIADFEKAIQYTPERTYTIISQLTHESENEQMQIFFETYADSSALSQTTANLPMAYYYRGIAYFGIGNIDHAITDFQKAIELGLDPEIAQTIEIYLPVP